MTTRVRTRFAPSPTGFIHLGNIRSALYPWAFARSQGGDFILRIEDTDVERSSQAAVDVILEGMKWLGLDPDEGPFYQMQRMDRYKQALAQMQAGDLVYPCYMSIAELDALRERQMAKKEKPRYDGTWRPEPGKTLPPVPEGVQPVLRFRNPVGGAVVWDDKVKGRIEISNDELDDLVIARPDGTPTYNFCVVVDDVDMAITHVIRGDDHVNNTPRQINIFRALGKEPPVYAHLPTVLNEQGEKMSKRSGAKPVTQFRDEGFLADAVVNYLARLGWSHGDAEIFSREQFLQWFSLDHLGRSAAQFDEAKLRWVNAQHLKAMADEELAVLVRPFLVPLGIAADHRLGALCGLLKDRCDTLVALAEWVAKFHQEVRPDPAELARHVTTAVRPAISMLARM
ncbi:MAG: gltX, partial [Ramlibacter sp.]|nr:gltX [Ramlibacter sp.]